MRIIPFPSRNEAAPSEAWLKQLEDALDGGQDSSPCDSWHELRADVRALAPPMSPEFERQLSERLSPRLTDRQPGKMAPSKLRRASAATSPAGGSTLAGSPHVPARPARFGGIVGRARRGFAWLRPPGRSGAVAAGAVTALAVAIAIVAAPTRVGNSARPSKASRPSVATSTVPGTGRPPLRAAGAARETLAAAATNSAGAASTKAAAAQATLTATPTATASTGRVQQLAASISLAATPSSVQETSDRVARVVVGDGGFVQNSHVQVQQAGPSEASLMLELPSAKLGVALASLAQLAPVRAESQSLADITNTYDAARQRVSDAAAERQALLRALARATTEGQIDSLRARLTQNASAIATAQAALHAVSQRASTAEVEVTVIGDAHATDEGLTLHRGLHDVGRVLTVTLIVVLVTAAVLVPLALLLATLAGLRSAWRRYRRERALGAR